MMDQTSAARGGPSQDSVVASGGGTTPLPSIRRVRSSLSDSLIEPQSENHFNSETVGGLPVRGDGEGEKRTAGYRKGRTVSLYGAPPICQFGPKACLTECQESILKIQDPGSQMLTWHKAPQSVLIIKKLWDDSIDQPFAQLALWLVKEKKLDVYIETSVLEDPLLMQQPAFTGIRHSLHSFKEGVDNENLGNIDFIICLGGDGTLLYASTLFQQSVPPVMAFHLGSLGFLSPFEFAEFEERITEVLRGVSVRLMLRTRLHCVVERSKESRCQHTSFEKQNILALNEVVVDRGASPYLCQLDLYIQGQQVTVVQGDGLIISTPTGSTAYAAAAGSSIVHPNVPAIVIAPICPHSLSFRPIVVPAGVEIKIMVSPDARGDAWASFDGRQRQCVSKGDVLIINTSKYPLPSICHYDPVRDWFNSLAACLHWNVRKSQLPLLSRAPSESRDSNHSDIRESLSSDSNGSLH